MPAELDPAAPDDPLAPLRSLRATRVFADEPLPVGLVDELIDVARWTGSARNRQPWRVAVATDAALRARLSRLGAYAGFLAGAPVVLLLAVDVAHGGADAEFDAGRFAQTLMLAAHVRGLGSCPATFFPDPEVEEATRLAGLAPPWRVRIGIGVGRPAAAPPPRPPGARSAITRGRRELDDVRTWLR